MAGANGPGERAGIPRGSNAPNEKLGIVGAVMPVKAPGTVGALGISKAVIAPPVTPGIVGTVGIARPVIIPLSLLMPGIAGGVAVKLAVNRFVNICKRLVPSTPPRRDNVAGLCCSIRNDTRGRRGRFECEIPS
jgi:hypothetical protein